MSAKQTEQLFKRAMLAAIPLIGEPELDAYTRLASTNYLWPVQRPANADLIPSNLPKECVHPFVLSNPNQVVTDQFTGNSTPYSSILRFTMIRDDDPYGQGVPAGSVGYWTLPMIYSNGKHLNSSCYIDGMGQIHGIQWEGLKSGLAITGDQEYKVEIILIGANCSWPESWDALFNGYVNAALNTVCQITSLPSTPAAFAINPRPSQKGEIEHQARLMSQIAGLFEGELQDGSGLTQSTLGQFAIIDEDSWRMIAGIWRQSQNCRIAPTLPTTDPNIIRKLGNRVVQDLDATQSSSLVSVINRRLI